MSNDYVEPMRQFILTRHLEPGEQLEDDTPLLEWSIIDSFTLVELLQFIEDRFGINVPNTAVNPTTFATLADISELLEQLEQDRGGEG